VPFLVALVFLLPASPPVTGSTGATGDRAGARPGDRTGGLPRAYWLTWIFLALCISAEFSFVVWGSQSSLPGPAPPTPMRPASRASTSPA